MYSCRVDPLVREHFGEQLKEAHPEAWREGHRRLYEYLKQKAKPLPETIEEMAPLYAAVVHGCMAGKPQEAYTEVFWKRIYREKQEFNRKTLGAFGSQVAVLSSFFDPPWERFTPGLTELDRLTELDQGWVQSYAGFALRALGRLSDGKGLLEEATQRFVTLEHWFGAARTASHLGELLHTRGELVKAEAVARESVAYADRSGDALMRMSRRTTLAAVLHARGRRDDATALFDEAEQIQKDRGPARQMLYDIYGFRYCDLLLDQNRNAEVLDRVVQTLKWAVEDSWLTCIALDHISLSRAHYLAALKSAPPEEQTHTKHAADHLQQAAHHLQQAIDFLRRAGEQLYVPLGLFARAALHIHTRDFAAAHHDLDEALTLAIRCAFRLHEADAHLGHARLALAEGNRVLALTHLARARKIIDETGYHRRDSELAELESGLAE